jgi:hypothetical protein
MKLTLRVTTQEETYDVVTNLGVIIAWERKFKAKASSLATNIGMEDLAYMAWECAKHSGIMVPLMFDDYVKKLDSIEVVSDESVNPTEGAPTPDH